MAKNLCGKSRTPKDPYEIWATPDGSWSWSVLKKYQSEDKEASNPYARWFCFVASPFCPDGEYGDTYVREIKDQARRVK